MIVVTAGALSVLMPPAAATAAPSFEVIESLRERAITTGEELGPEPRDAPPAVVRTAGTAATEEKAVAKATPPTIATVQGVSILVPSSDTLAIGFHEGATRSLGLTPVFDVPDGTPVPQVMPSRGRGTGETTAIDIAIAVNAPVVTPVSGEVVEANEYALYGSTRDLLVTVAPNEAPNLRVRMFHMEELKVSVGDQVVAGETVIAARSRVLPFASQVDRISGDRFPHLHVQVDGS